MYAIMDEMYVRGDSLIIKLLFLKDSSTLCYNSFLSIILHCFSDHLLMEGFSYYIEFSKSSPLYSCSSSNPALKYVSYQASSLAFCERQWLRPQFRGLLHINAARKVAAVHLTRWWQLFPKIFMYPYPLRTCLKSILIVGVSWKIIQVTWMLARLIFVRYEEGNLLGPQPSTLSLRDYLFWGLPSHLLLLGRIPISKQGLRPNVQIQVFAPTILIFNFIQFSSLIIFFNIIVKCSKRDPKIMSL